MKVYLKLALRNVLRYKKRTIITFSSIAFGLGLMAIGMSFYKGIDKQTLQNLIESETSHIKIFAPGYFEKKDDFPLNLNMKDTDQIIQSLKMISEVKAVEPRIRFLASLIKGMDELPCEGVAIDPEISNPAFALKSDIVAGEYLNRNDHKMLIGSRLAKDLDIKVGDTCVIRIFSSAEDFIWNALDLEVKGIIETGNSVINSQSIFIPIKLAQEGLGLKNKITEVAIRLTGNEVVGSVVKKIKKMLSEKNLSLETFHYLDQAADFLKINKFKKRAQSLIPLIMLLIATLGIINTMLMAVMERVREIGMLSALGMRKKEIMRLFILEGAYIGFFGSLTGCIIGALGGWYLESVGIKIGSFGPEMIDMFSKTIPMPDVFYGDLTLGILVFTLIFGVVVSILASLYPAYRAIKINPVKALRHV